MTVDLLMDTHFLNLLLMVFYLFWTLCWIKSVSFGVVKEAGHLMNSGASPRFPKSASTLSPYSICDLSEFRKKSRSSQLPAS